MAATVFFYGLFMDAGVLAVNGCTPRATRRAVVDGYALRIGERATLVREPGGRVHGLVIDLDLAEVRRLYALPGLGDYERIELTARLAEGECVADCYVLPPGLLTGSNSQYAGELAALARRLGFPADYVASIEAMR